MTVRGYDHDSVEKVASAIYRAVKLPEGSTWAAFKRHAERDPTAKAVLDHWYAVAIAALDMANGASARLHPR